MDRWQAQYEFWNGFTLDGETVKAYEENSVPDASDVTFPYISYQAMTGGFNGDASVNASIWDRSTSWEKADRLADAMEAELANGGKVVPYTGGLMWFSAGMPFAQAMGDDSDDMIKRKLLTVTIHFA